MPPEQEQQNEQENQETTQEQHEQAAEQQPAGRPEGIPEELWTDTGFNADAFAQYRAPAADLPSAADGYQLPAIDGVELDTADPLFATLRETAFENGIGQEGFNGFVSKYAEALKAADDAAYEASMKALGDTAQSRIDAVSTWLDGTLPKAEADALKALATSADTVQALERLMNRKAPVAPRDTQPTAPTRKSEAEIRTLMASKAYSGKPGERDPAVIKEVEDWYKEEARLEAEAGKAREVTAR